MIASNIPQQQDTAAIAMERTRKVALHQDVAQIDRRQGLAGLERTIEARQKTRDLFQIIDAVQ